MRIFEAFVVSTRFTGFRGGGISSELDEPALWIPRGSDQCYILKETPSTYYRLRV